MEQIIKDKIDGKRYKADTWYTMRDGKIVEWKES